MNKFFCFTFIFQQRSLTAQNGLISSLIDRSTYNEILPKRLLTNFNLKNYGGQPQQQITFHNPIIANDIIKHANNFDVLKNSIEAHNSLVPMEHQMRTSLTNNPFNIPGHFSNSFNQINKNAFNEKTHHHHRNNMTSSSLSEFFAGNQLDHRGLFLFSCTFKPTDS